MQFSKNFRPLFALAFSRSRINFTPSYPAPRLIQFFVMTFGDEAKMPNNNNIHLAKRT